MKSLAAFVFAALLHGQRPPMINNVAFAVTAPTDEVKNVISSHLSRELRELKDVNIVDFDYSYMLDVVAVSINNEGLALSCVVSEKVKTSNLSDYQPLPRESKDSLASKLSILHSVLSRPSWVDMHILKIASTPAELPKTCKAIVTSFDVTVLETIRKIRNSAQLPRQ